MDTLTQLRSGQLNSTQRLNLSGDFTEFPAEIFDLADSLEVLDLSNNRLSSLPDDLGRLKQLKILFCNNNQFEELPAVLSHCPNLSMASFKANRIQTVDEEALTPTLRWLVLTDNQIDALPDAMGQLPRLQKLMLAGNRLRSLPETMAACHNLELVRLAANQLETLPTWLFDLPRLSWIAYAGNPLCRQLGFAGGDSAAADEPQAARIPFTEIDWMELSMGEVLGQGASGIISKALWTPPSGEPQTVAVKIFKGAITSDGLPDEEMQTCIAAGTHDNLVNVLGKIAHHPEQKQGLVLSFIPPHYTNLGNPPSLDSCTRDTYSPDTTFSLPVLLRIVQGIAAAAAHLHTRSILHGDLYAHNILIDETGHPLLGDFGAASRYSVADSKIREALQSIEVRAFGCLLEDLLDRCSTQSNSAYLQLRQLQNDCMIPVPTQRPSFEAIATILSSV
ncbi:MAG: leucine-rich repeat-containing protein kinase family protein [Elainellaceae cyanobacterium]